MWKSLLCSHLWDDSYSNLFVVDQQGKCGAKELRFENHVDITESAVIGRAKTVQVVECRIHVACLHATFDRPCIVQKCNWSPGCQSCYLYLQVRIRSIIGNQYPVSVCRIVEITCCSDSVHNNVDFFAACCDDNISMWDCWTDKSKSGS
jgi:hypothetical protein